MRVQTSEALVVGEAGRETRSNKYKKQIRWSHTASASLQCWACACRTAARCRMALAPGAGQIGQ
eukprot:2874033-Prymnesium_polylepis.1